MLAKRATAEKQKWYAADGDNSAAAAAGCRAIDAVIRALSSVVAHVAISLNDAAARRGAARLGAHRKLIPLCIRK